MAPTLFMAAAQGIGEGIKGFAQYQGQKYASKKQAKENKRRTLAELLNAAFQREFEAGEGMKKRGADLASARANALQNIASQYVQALR